MDTHYKLRITSPIYYEPIVAGMTKYSYVLEGSTDSSTATFHYHYHLITSLTRQALIKRIKNHPDYTVGNKFYSLGELKPDEQGYLKYDTYMAKDGNPTYVGFTDQEISSIQTNLQLVKEDIKSSKKSRRTQLQKIEEEYFIGVRLAEQDDQLILPYDKPNWSVTTKEYIQDSVLDFYMKNNITFSKHKIISTCQWLAIKYVPHYKVEYLRDLDW